MLHLHYECPWQLLMSASSTSAGSRQSGSKVQTGMICTKQVLLGPHVVRMLCWYRGAVQARGKLLPLHLSTRLLR